MGSKRKNKKAQKEAQKEQGSQVMEETPEKETEGAQEAEGKVQEDAASGPEVEVNEVATEEEAEKCQEDILRDELNTVNDKYLRLSAEFDNYRKRTLKEKIDMTKTAGQELLVDILPVMDNFERAMKALETAKDLDAVKEGMSLIFNKFQEFLSQKGLKEIEAMHKEFDSELHEAVTKIPAPEEELKGKNVDVIEKGYYLYDKVVRYAKVVIGE